MVTKHSLNTTTGGVVAMIAGTIALLKLANDFLTNQPITLEQITLAIGLISGGFVGIKARDNHVTSEEAGAK